MNKINHTTIHSFQYQGKRSSQEDAFFISNSKDVFIICDGVGSGKGGSQIAQTFLSVFQSNFIKITKDLTKEKLLKCIKISFQKTQDIFFINEYSNTAATTISILAILKNNFFHFHLGDSKTIIIRKDESAIWQSKDHSVVQELFDEGLLSNESLKYDHPLKNQITKAFNINYDISDVNKDVQTIPKLDNDLILMLTDGVTEQINEKKIIKLLSDAKPLLQWQYLESICDNFSQDNSTALLIQL